MSIPNRPWPTKSAGVHLVQTSLNRSLASRRRGCSPTVVFDLKAGYSSMKFRWCLRRKDHPRSFLVHGMALLQLPWAIPCFACQVSHNMPETHFLSCSASYYFIVFTIQGKTLPHGFGTGDACVTKANHYFGNRLACVARAAHWTAGNESPNAFHSACRLTAISYTQSVINVTTR